MVLTELKLQRTTFIKYPFVSCSESVYCSWKASNCHPTLKLQIMTWKFKAFLDSIFRIFLDSTSTVYHKKMNKLCNVDIIGKNCWFGTFENIHEKEMQLSTVNGRNKRTDCKALLLQLLIVLLSFQGMTPYDTMSDRVPGIRTCLPNRQPFFVCSLRSLMARKKDQNYFDLTASHD